MITASVTAVIPFFRDHATIERAVKSVLAQTVPPRQIVVVDDASGDPDSARALARVASLGATVHTFSTNRGPAEARNTGWDAAEGDFVAFLDADDAWHPRKLEIQLETMTGPSAPALSGHRFVREGSPAHTPSANTFRNLSLRAMLAKNLLRTPTVMLRAELPFRFDPSLRYCEDYDLWLRILAAGHVGVYSSEPLAWSFKPDFGAAGLSSHIPQMEAGQNEVYRRLRRSGAISTPTYVACRVWGATRYVARIGRTALQNRATERRTIAGSGTS